MAGLLASNTFWRLQLAGTGISWFRFEMKQVIHLGQSEILHSVLLLSILIQVIRNYFVSKRIALPWNVIPFAGWCTQKAAFSWVHKKQYPQCKCAKLKCTCVKQKKERNPNPRNWGEKSMPSFQRKLLTLARSIVYGYQYRRQGRKNWAWFILRVWSKY